ncbi:MAG: TrkA C-terminal domain-containing protein, partial [Candidatus Omnitrophota bacterium]
MLTGFTDLCRSYPQIPIFLALAIGYYIGKIKIYGFSLGATAGTLIAALVLGQMNIEVPALAKAIGFALFIFTIGYKVGPQFFGALKSEGLKYIWLSLFFAAVGLITAVILGKAFGFGPGTTAGIIGGALTQSSVIGTADGAISHLLVPAAQKTTMESNVAISYAITYIFGVAGLIVFYKLIPRILKINLKDEARQLEKEMSGGTEEAELAPELFSWRNQLNLRAYKVTSENIKGKTVSEVEKIFPGNADIDRIKRGSDIIDPEPGTVIQSGDIIAFVGRRKAFIKADTVIGPEVDDKDVVDLIGEMLKICVLNPEAVGKTLDEIDRECGHGISLRKLSRQGHAMPLTKDTVVDKCDVFYVTGSKK